MLLHFLKEQIWFLPSELYSDYEVAFENGSTSTNWDC